MYDYDPKDYDPEDMSDIKIESSNDGEARPILGLLLMIIAIGAFIVIHVYLGRHPCDCFWPIPTFFFLLFLLVAGIVTAIGRSNVR